jgi:hypothetical protein
VPTIPFVTRQALTGFSPQEVSALANVLYDTGQPSLEEQDFVGRAAGVLVRWQDIPSQKWLRN